MTAQVQHSSNPAPGHNLLIPPISNSSRDGGGAAVAPISDQRRPAVRLSFARPREARLDAGRLRLRPTRPAIAQLAWPPLCYLDSIILNLVIIVIWVVSFCLHIIICYACITLEIILATKILNVQGISYQIF
jgi:hypothetical protein